MFSGLTNAVSYAGENITSFIDNSTFLVLSEDQGEQSDVSFVWPIIATLGFLLASGACTFCYRKFTKIIELTRELCEEARKPNPDLQHARNLIQQGAWVTGYDADEYLTPLHWAAKTGSPAMIQFLVDSGARLEQKDSIAQLTPFQIAVQEGNVEGMKKLLELGAQCNVEKGGNSPLALAIRASREKNWDLAKCQEVLTVLVENGLDLASEETLKLCTKAGGRGSPGMIEALIQLVGGDAFFHEDGTDKVSSTPLSRALKEKNFENLRKILELCPLEKICTQANFKFIILRMSIKEIYYKEFEYTKEDIQQVLQIFEEKGIDLVKSWDADAKPILTDPIRFDNLAMVEALVERGAPVRYINDSGEMTPLILYTALIHYKPDICAYLIENDDRVREEGYLKNSLNLVMAGCVKLETDIKMNKFIIDRDPPKTLEDARRILGSLLSAQRGAPVTDEDIDGVLAQFEQRRA